MLNPRHSFLSFINHASRLDRVRFAINFSRSIAGKVARFGKFERMTLPRMTPLLIFDVYGRMRISPSQFPRFLNSSIPSSPFLWTPSNHLGTSIMNETYRVWRGRFRIRGWEIDTRGFLRETRGWEKLLEMWKRREAWPCLLIPCYLFIFFLMRISVADLGDDCNCCEDNIEIMIFLSDQF